MLFREILKVNTKKGVYFEDITGRILEIAEECAIQEGLCNIYLSATTAGLMINENDRMLLEDFRLFFEHLVNEKKPYLHPARAKHVLYNPRASFLGSGDRSAPMPPAVPDR